MPCENLLRLSCSGRAAELFFRLYSGLLREKSRYGTRLKATTLIEEAIYLRHSFAIFPTNGGRVVGLLIL